MREVAAKHYQGRRQFNFRQRRARRQRDASTAANPRTRQQATLRLVFERATMVAIPFDRLPEKPP